MIGKGYCNILLIQLGDIGDVVLTTSAIRALRETYPAARVSIMVRKPFGSLLTADPNIFHVIEHSKVRGSFFNVLSQHARFVTQLRKARHDLVIDLRTGDRGAILSFCTGAKERVGLYVDGKERWHNLLFTNTIRDAPVGLPTDHPGADQSLRILRSMGIVTKSSDPKIYVAPADRKRAVKLLADCGLSSGVRWITVNPFSRWPYKEWDYGKWGQVMDSLWERHRLRSLLIGSQEEYSAAAAISEGRKGCTFNFAGKTSLGELAAILSMSTLHLGVDSAAPHITAAVGTPTITIHGPSDWRAWRVINDMHKVVISPMACVPCHRMGCSDSGRSICLDELEMQSVLDVVEEMLSSTCGAIPHGDRFEDPS